MSFPAKLLFNDFLTPGELESLWLNLNCISLYQTPVGILFCQKSSCQRTSAADQ